MIGKKRIKSVMVEPVCTTFSPAAHPAVRSYKTPLGYGRRLPKTLRGNTIAFRCLATALVCCLQEVPVLVEQPRLSKMAWLSTWQFLLRYQHVEEAIVASCQFGSSHRRIPAPGFSDQHEECGTSLSRRSMIMSSLQESIRSPLLSMRHLLLSILPSISTEHYKMASLWRKRRWQYQALSHLSQMIF